MPYSVEAEQNHFLYLQLIKVPSNSADGFLYSLCKSFKLTLSQEVLFVGSLQNSTHSDLQRLAREQYLNLFSKLIEVSLKSDGKL